MTDIKKTAAHRKVWNIKKELVKAGITLEQLSALQLAVLEQVQAHADSDGNASQYVNYMITGLRGIDLSTPRTRTD